MADHRSKAEHLVGLLAGNVALEGDSITPELREQLIQKTVRELERKARKRERYKLNKISRDMRRPDKA